MLPGICGCSAHQAGDLPVAGLTKYSFSSDFKTLAMFIAFPLRVLSLESGGFSGHTGARSRAMKFALRHGFYAYAIGTLRRFRPE
jgi:hypothetical protein